MLSSAASEPVLATGALAGVSRVMSAQAGRGCIRSNLRVSQASSLRAHVLFPQPQLVLGARDGRLVGVRAQLAQALGATHAAVRGPRAAAGQVHLNPLVVLVRPDRAPLAARHSGGRRPNKRGGIFSEALHGRTLVAGGLVRRCIHSKELPVRATLLPRAAAYLAVVQLPQLALALALICWRRMRTRATPAAKQPRPQALLLGGVCTPGAGHLQNRTWPPCAKNVAAGSRDRKIGGR